MLSLSNSFDQEDLKNFEKKIINFLNLNKNAKIDSIDLLDMKYKNMLILKIFQ